MIARLQGKLISKKPDQIIIDVNGVGYEVFISEKSLTELPEIGDEVIFYIHTNVSETSFNLFGFLTELDKSIFRKLISISGIGPKLGLQILSGLSAHDLVHIVMNDDLGRLTQINGIGKKTASRIMIELKDKLANVSELDLKTVSESNQISSISSKNSKLEEASLALQSLGYQKNQIEKIISQINFDQNTSVEDIIKQGLKLVS